MFNQSIVIIYQKQKKNFLIKNTIKRKIFEILKKREFWSPFVKKLIYI